MLSRTPMTLELEETFAQSAFEVVSRAYPGMSEFYSPVASIWQTRMCDIPGAHLQGSKTCNGQHIRAEPQLISSLVTCAVQGLSAFTPLLLRTRNPGFALFEAHTLLGWTAHIQKGIRSDCFCGCKLRCCRAECVLLLGFKRFNDRVSQ